MRRGLIAAIVLASSLLPGCGDEGKPDRTIAFLRTTPIAQASQDAFLETLDDSGWTEGENLTVLNPDPSSGFEDEQDGTALVESFVEAGADLIVALSTSAALLASDGAPDIPVVTLSNDLVGSGFVEDERAPDGNVTGIAYRVPADRTIDVARQVVGGDGTVGLLWPQGDPGAEPVVVAATEAASSIGVRLVAQGFDGDDDVESAVATIRDEGVDVVVLANAPSTVRSFDALEGALDGARLPAVANTNLNTFAVAVLAPDNIAVYRQLGHQVGRLLGGTDVSDVPVEDPGVFQLVVRPAIAEQLGIVLGPDLLAQADTVEDQRVSG